MSEQTSLNSIADNLAERFFDGSGSSENVITPPTDKEESQTPGTTEENLDTFNNRGENFEGISAKDLIGDRLLEETETTQEPETSIDGSLESPKSAETPANFNALIEDQILFPFDDDSEIKTIDDLKEIIKANKEEWVKEAKEAAINEDREALPEEVKFVLEYAKTGGNDLKSVFKLLSQSREVKEYDIDSTNDQKEIVRAYHMEQGWSEEETEEELVNLVNSNRLEAYAKKIKPKLDRSIQDRIEQEREIQKRAVERQENARKFFVDNVVTTLKKGKLGDIQLTKEDQTDIYNALVVEQYQGINGRTNRLGALLDKIQFIEPDYEHLAEVVMHLSDREGFKKKLLDQINTQVTAENVRKIKIDQQKAKIGSKEPIEQKTKKLPKLGIDFLR